MKRHPEGYYNYRSVMDYHYASYGTSSVLHAFNEKINNIFDMSVIDRSLPNDIIVSAYHQLEAFVNKPNWHKTASATAKRNMWNAWCIAMWEREKLARSTMVNNYIKYKDDIVYSTENTTDHWNGSEVTGNSSCYNGGEYTEYHFEPRHTGWW